MNVSLFRTPDIYTTSLPSKQHSTLFLAAPHLYLKMDEKTRERALHCIKDESLFELHGKDPIFKLREVGDKFEVCPLMLPPRAYRDFNNQLKKSLINSFCRNKVVLDIGTGVGGDIFKYQVAGTKFIHAVEPDSDKIVEMLSRMKGAPIEKKVSIYNVGGEVAIDVKVDVVAAMFSLSFFFQSSSILDKLTSNVASSLVTKGFFIGVMMDGGRVFALPSLVTEGEFYTITKKYSSHKLSIGLPIVVNFSGTPTVKGDQEEWLGIFAELVHSLEKKGVLLRESGFLDEVGFNGKDVFPFAKRKFGAFTQLSEAEQNLESLYRYFVFQKV